jgi:hypothetical protein
MHLVSLNVVARTAINPLVFTKGYHTLQKSKKQMGNYQPFFSNTTGIVFAKMYRFNRKDLL